MRGTAADRRGLVSRPQGSNQQLTSLPSGRLGGGGGGIGTRTWARKESKVGNACKSTGSNLIPMVT